MEPRRDISSCVCYHLCSDSAVYKWVMTSRYSLCLLVPIVASFMLAAAMEVSLSFKPNDSLLKRRTIIWTWLVKCLSNQQLIREEVIWAWLKSSSKATVASIQLWTTILVTHSPTSITLQLPHQDHHRRQIIKRRRPSIATFRQPGETCL